MLTKLGVQIIPQATMFSFYSHDYCCKIKQTSFGPRLYFASSSTWIISTSPMATSNNPYFLPCATCYSCLFLFYLIPLTQACSAAAMQHATKGIPPCFKALGWICDINSNLIKRAKISNKWIWRMHHLALHFQWWKEWKFIRKGRLNLLSLMMHRVYLYMYQT